MLVTYDKERFLYFGSAPIKSGIDERISGETFNSSRGGQAITANDYNTDYYIQDVTVNDHKYGIHVSSKTTVTIFDYEFIGTTTDNPYAAAIARNKYHEGQIQAKRVYADGEDQPLNRVSGGYDKTNTDFFTNNVNAGASNDRTVQYFRDITAYNFSDTMFDAKSTIYIMNATIENAYRMFRVWDEAEIILVNSIVNTGEGKSLLWLHSTAGRVKYYNTLWDGKATPDYTDIDVQPLYGTAEITSAKRQVTELSSNPLPNISSFFAPDTARYTAELSVNGDKWIKLVLPDNGDLRNFIGDPLFEVPDVGRGAYHIRTYKTTSDGRTVQIDDQRFTVSDSNFAYKSGIQSVTLKHGGSEGFGGSGAPIPGDTTTTAPSDPGAFRVFIVDTNTDRTLAEVRDGGTVDAALVQGRDLTLYAEIDGSVGGSVGSVRMDFENGRIRTVENVAPYALFGDKDGDFFGDLSLSSGGYTLKLQAFSLAGAQGVKRAEAEIDFMVGKVGTSSTTQRLAVADENIARIGDADADVIVFLVDAGTGARVLEVGDNGRVSRDALAGKSLAFLVEGRAGGAVAGVVDRMTMDFEDGEVVVDDNAAPFTILDSGRAFGRGYYDLDIRSYADGRLLDVFNLDFEVY